VKIAGVNIAWSEVHLVPGNWKEGKRGDSKNLAETVGVSQMGTGKKKSLPGSVGAQAPIIRKEETEGGRWAGVL